ncbi:protein P54-like, partial [Frankliniella occidentalis]|uniref:Protein P54-like n=1 Tax=Frankliniella occidentalis TaxID=133901 RepID=A0A9C6XW42_FRAOC
MAGPCELDRNLRECNVVLDRLLPGDAEARMARMAVKECRVVLERLTEAAVSAAGTTASTTAGTITTDEDEDEDEEPRTTRVWRRVLRNTTKTTAASTTVREQTGMGRLRSSARYPLRQKRLSQQDTVMEVTKRSSWRRGRTRSKKPPSSTSTAVSVRTGELARCAQTEPTEPGAAGQAEQRAQGDADTCEAPAPTPAPAPPNAPNRRLLCFRVVIEAMVRPSTGASIGFGALFDDDEKAVLQRWLELSEGAAATYLHLLASPGPWVRGTTLAASCPGLREHFAALEKTGFVSS